MPCSPENVEDAATIGFYGACGFGEVVAGNALMTFLGSLSICGGPLSHSALAASTATGLPILGAGTLVLCLAPPCEINQNAFGSLGMALGIIICTSMAPVVGAGVLGHTKAAELSYAALSGIVGSVEVVGTIHLGLTMLRCLKSPCTLLTGERVFKLKERYERQVYVARLPNQAPIDAASLTPNAGRRMIENGIQDGSAEFIPLEAFVDSLAPEARQSIIEQISAAHSIRDNRVTSTVTPMSRVMS